MTYRFSGTVSHTFFQAGNVRSFVLDFVISLKPSTSIQLFRFLDMMRAATTPPRCEFAKGVFKIAERLAMTKYRHASKVEEKLAPAIGELQERGHLRAMSYEKSKYGMELVFFHFVVPKAGNGESSWRWRAWEPLNTQASSAGAENSRDIQVDSSRESDIGAAKCYTVSIAPDDAERNGLLDLAKAKVNPIWHDRVGQVESPMSLGLWKLVAARHKIWRIPQTAKLPNMETMTPNEVCVHRKTTRAQLLRWEKAGVLVQADRGEYDKDDVSHLISRGPEEHAHGR